MHNTQMLKRNPQQHPRCPAHSLQAVTQHQQQGQALALLVGTGRGLGGLQACITTWGQGKAGCMQAQVRRECCCMAACCCYCCCCWWGLGGSQAGWTLSGAAWVQCQQGAAPPAADPEGCGVLQPSILTAVDMLPWGSCSAAAAAATPVAG